MDKKVTGIVSYITIVGWAVAYFCGDKEGAKRHLNQGLVLGVVGIALGVVIKVLSFIPIIRVIAGIAGSLAGLALLVLCIIGIYHAAMDDDVPLPFIGNIQLLK